MARIGLDLEDNFHVITVFGPVNADEIISAIREYYAKKIAQDVIWDFSNAKLDSITEQDLAPIVLTAKDVLPGGMRNGGKTAYVGNTASKLAILHRYLEAAEDFGIAGNCQIFETLGEAKTWVVTHG